MRIPAATVQLRAVKDDDARGLLLEYLRTLMKANRGNTDSPIAHFRKERLSRREHRAALNAMLNALSQRLAADKPAKKGRGSQILDSAGEGISPDLIESMQNEIETLKLHCKELDKRLSLQGESLAERASDIGELRDAVKAVERSSGG